MSASDAPDARPAPTPPPADFDPLSEERVSAFVEAMGARLTEWREGFARLEGPVGPTLINRQGVVHGGAYMTLLDTAAGYAGCFCPYPGRKRKALTLSFTVNFIAAARAGALVTEGRVAGGGRSVFFAEAKVMTAEGAVLASGSGSFKYRTGSGELWGVLRER